MSLPIQILWPNSEPRVAFERLISGIRDAPVARYELRRGDVSGVNARFERSFERREFLLVRRQ